MAFDYSAWQVVAILATYALAATAKGVTGLGFSTTCLPFLVVVVGLKEALPLVILPSVSANLVVMRRTGHFRETVGRFWPMLLATMPGLALGLWALTLVDGQQAAGLLGAILVLWCGFSLVTPQMRLPARLELPLGPLSGLLTGAVNGVTGTQVMPLVPFLMMLRLDRSQFIQTVNCSFTLSSLGMAVGLNSIGLFTTDALVLSALGICVIFVGLNAGERLRHHLSPERFRIAVLLMLMVMGASLLVQGI